MQRLEESDQVRGCPAGIQRRLELVNEPFHHRGQLEVSIPESIGAEGEYLDTGLFELSAVVAEALELLEAWQAPAGPEINQQCGRFDFNLARGLVVQRCVTQRRQRQGLVIFNIGKTLVINLVKT